MNNLKHISLFTGCMGFDLGAEWAGIETVATCEKDTYLQKLIREKYEGKKCIHHDLIETFNYTIHANIISAGFPCSDISEAVGKAAKGINGPNSGLWKHIIRICRNNRPEYVLIENSPKILIRGFGELLHAFSQLGYVCEWQCIQNAAFGFPDKRERLYLIAYPIGIGSQARGPVFTGNVKNHIRTANLRMVPTGSSIEEIEKSLSQPAVFGENPGFSRTMDRVKALGNAVNPVAAHYFFELIKNHRNG